MPDVPTLCRCRSRGSRKITQKMLFKPKDKGPEVREDINPQMLGGWEFQDKGLTGSIAGFTAAHGHTSGAAQCSGPPFSAESGDAA